MDRHKNAMFMKIRSNLDISEFILFSITYLRYNRILSNILHGQVQNNEHNLCTSSTMLFTYLEHEPLRGSGGMPLQKILKSGGSEMLFRHFLWHFSSEKSILGQNQDEAIASSRLMLATVLQKLFLLHEAKMANSP